MNISNICLWRTCSVAAVVLLSGSFAFANPSMLPQHPGYPMGKAVDPVRGKSLANDPGQSNAVGDKALQKASGTDVDHIIQSLPMNQGDKRILEKPGAGILPRVEGPAITIDPPIKPAKEVQTQIGAPK